VAGSNRGVQLERPARVVFSQANSPTQAMNTRGGADPQDVRRRTAGSQRESGRVSSGVGRSVRVEPHIKRYNSAPRQLFDPPAIQKVMLCADLRRRRRRRGGREEWKECEMIERPLGQGETDDMSSFFAVRFDGEGVASEDGCLEACHGITALRGQDFLVADDLAVADVQDAVRKYGQVHVVSHHQHGDGCAAHNPPGPRERSDCGIRSRASIPLVYEGKERRYRGNGETRGGARSRESSRRGEGSALGGQ